MISTLEEVETNKGTRLVQERRRQSDVEYGSQGGSRLDPWWLPGEPQCSGAEDGWRSARYDHGRLRRLLRESPMNDSGRKRSHGKNVSRRCSLEESEPGTQGEP